jgi:hypothetical protein
MAAGLGFKTFTTGEVLTAADTNGYLMQGVLVFASSAARAAAITSPQEGQYSYLKDTNSTEYYDGAAWIAAPIGDITGVTAGTGISGGGTSGTVTVTNSMATAIDAKGDLVAGTGADAFSRLGVGANNTVLTADSAEATGLKWATPAGGGKVLQAVYASYSTSASNSTNTYADTGLTASITPTLNTSKVLVIVSQNGVNKSAGNASNRIALRLLRGATALITLGDYFLYNGTAVEIIGESISFSYLDSPATTSATAYKTQFMNPQNVAAAGVQFTSSHNSTITLLEIGA